MRISDWSSDVCSSDLGEEPNVHLGGHWISFFPKPVYWTLDRKEGQPFVENDPKLGKIYHVGSQEDVLKLMQDEKGLMWTAHPRIKGSTGYPDKRSEEHTSELQSLMRISYAVFCLKKQN